MTQTRHNLVAETLGLELRGTEHSQSYGQYSKDRMALLRCEAARHGGHPTAGQAGTRLHWVSQSSLGFSHYSSCTDPNTVTYQDSNINRKPSFTPGPDWASL